MAFPKVIWVRKDKETDEEYLVAWDNLADGIEDDGPTMLGVYKLVETIKRKKVVAEAK